MANICSMGFRSGPYGGGNGRCAFAALYIKRTKHNTLKSSTKAAMQDRAINNALIALHKAGGEQAELARKILALRGVEPPRLIERAAPVAIRGAMKRMVLEALRDGPKPRKQIVAYVAPLRPDVPPERLYWRVDAALSKLRHAGRVRRKGRVWAAQPLAARCIMMALLHKSCEGFIS